MGQIFFVGGSKSTYFFVPCALSTDGLMRGLQPLVIALGTIHI